MLPKPKWREKGLDSLSQLSHLPHGNKYNVGSQSQPRTLSMNVLGVGMVGGVWGVGEKGRHEAQAPSNQVKNYKQT